VVSRAGLAKKLPLLSHSFTRRGSRPGNRMPITGKRPNEPARSKPSIVGIRNILVVGDLHVGSIYGMLPPDFVSSDGAEKPQNVGQKYLWDCWQNMKTNAARFSIDSVVVNGDLIEGKQPKQRASELTLVAPNDQESAAVFLMRDLRNWIEKNTGRQVPFFFVQGTEYHEGRGAEELESIAARVQGANINSNFSGRYCKEVLDLDMGGTVLNFAHHVGGGSGFTRSGSLDAEALWCQITSSKGQAVSADLIVRSHLHFFMHVEHTNRHAFLCPCWQLQTRFARHRSAYKLMPDIGALIFHISSEAKKHGVDPIAFTKMLYRLPTPRVNKFERGKKLREAV
jgi:hypothetical protein